MATLQERISEEFGDNVHLLTNNDNIAIVYRDLVVNDHKRFYTTVASDWVAFVGGENWLDKLPAAFKEQCHCGIHDDIKSMVAEQPSAKLEELFKELVGVCRIEWDSSELYTANPQLWQEIKERNGMPIQVRSYNIVMYNAKEIWLKYIW